MRKLFLTSAAALAISCGATVVVAQNATNAPNATQANNPSAAASAMTSQQRTAYDAWPAERRTMYDAWPAEYQAYFWSLSDAQKTGWFALTDAQRKQVYEMPPASRAQAWSSIEQQLAGASATGTPSSAPAPDAAAAPTTGETSGDATAPVQTQAGPAGVGSGTDAPDPAMAGELVTPARPADPNSHGGASSGALTQPPADAMNKTYPVCTRKLQDSCQNPGEGGARGRSRAI